jgi:hypothetical protein
MVAVFLGHVGSSCQAVHELLSDHSNLCALVQVGWGSPLSCWGAVEVAKEPWAAGGIWSPKLQVTVTFFVILGFELRAYTLGHSISPSFFL